MEYYKTSVFRVWPRRSKGAEKFRHARLVAFYWLGYLWIF